MSDADYYEFIYIQLAWRDTFGDPLEGVPWGVSATLMEWGRLPGWNRSFFVNIKGPTLAHAVTAEATMADSSHPWHVQLCEQSRRQRRRIASILGQRAGRVTLRPQKWAPGGFHQASYQVVGGSLLTLLESSFKEFSLPPPLQESQISF